MSHPRPSSQPLGLPFPKGEGAAATPANPRAQAGGGGQGWAAARAWDLGRACRAPAPSPGGRVPGNGQQCAVWPEDPHAPHRRSRQHRSQSRGGHVPISQLRRGVGKGHTHAAERGRSVAPRTRTTHCPARPPGRTRRRGEPAGRTCARVRDARIRSERAAGDSGGRAGAGSDHSRAPGFRLGSGDRGPTLRTDLLPPNRTLLNG